MIVVSVIKKIRFRLYFLLYYWCHWNK